MDIFQIKGDNKEEDEKTEERLIQCRMTWWKNYVSCMNTYGIGFSGVVSTIDSYINHIVSDTREYTEYVFLCVYVCVRI